MAPGCPVAGDQEPLPLPGTAYLLLRITSSKTAAAAARMRATIFVGSMIHHLLSLIG